MARSKQQIEPVMISRADAAKMLAIGERTFRERLKDPHHPYAQHIVIIPSPARCLISDVRKAAEAEREQWEG